MVLFKRKEKLIKHVCNRHQEKNREGLSSVPQSLFEFE